jgi:hypothetical protein
VFADLGFDQFLQLRLRPSAINEVGGLVPGVTPVRSAAGDAQCGGVEQHGVALGATFVAAQDVAEGLGVLRGVAKFNQPRRKGESAGTGLGSVFFSAAADAGT